jgi:hypothetical protein
MSALLKLYPPAWRARYGDEMTSLLEERPLLARDRLDLIRGALDAWLHPVRPSIVPIAAALLGGGLWTALSIGLLVQPVPADWPGYLLEVVPLAAVAAACFLVAGVGCLLRAEEGRIRSASIAGAVLVVGHLAWISLLVGTLVGWVGGPALGAAQSIAIVGTLATGFVLVRDRIDPIGLLLLAGPIALLIPSTVTWPVFGAAWTGVGIALWLDRQARIESVAGGGLRPGPA